MRLPWDNPLLDVAAFDGVWNDLSLFFDNTNPSSNGIIGDMDSPNGIRAKPEPENQESYIDSKINAPKKPKIRIIKKVGQGGMGIVYKAQQVFPVQRYIALKIIRPNDFSPKTISRFNREFQILASMNHDNIAKIYEVGFTKKGSPFFTMEYVEQAQWITDYCDGQRLDIDKRIHIFLNICDGVAHAHQKGMIHRDLKPSNILASCLDNTLKVKIIDFGIAKQANTNEPLFYQDNSSHNTFIGTPSYMSPEQTKAHGQAMDTRSDIYSLGAILYELLVGFPVLDEEMFKGIDLFDKIYAIRHIQPIPLSNRLILGAEKSVDAARNRSVKLQQLRNLLKGDLENIVSKALQKEPNLRYQHIDDLKRDLQRYLEKRPVSVGPTSLSYLAKKFFQRRKALAIALITGGVATLAGITAITIGLVQTHRAREAVQRSLEETRHTNRFFMDMLASPHPYREGQDTKLFDILIDGERKLQNLTGYPHLQASVRGTLGRMYFAMGKYEHACRQFEQSLAMHAALGSEDSANALISKDHYARCLREMDQLKRAERIYLQILPMMQEKLSDRGTAFWNAMVAYAELLQRDNRLDQAETLCQKAYDALKASHGLADLSTLLAGIALANMKSRKARWEEALAQYRSIEPALTEALPEDHPTFLNLRLNKSIALIESRQYTEAERELCRLLPHSHRSPPMAWRIWHNLGRIYLEQGLFPEAEHWTQLALAGRENGLPVNHRETLRSRANLALIASGLNRLEEAAFLQEALLEDFFRLDMGTERDALRLMNNLGDAWIRLSRFEEALNVLSAGLSLKEEVFGPSSTEALITRCTLGEAFQAKGDWTMAEREYRQTVELAWQAEPPDLAWLPTFIHYHAACLMSMKQPQEAETILRANLKILEAYGRPPQNLFALLKKSQRAGRLP